MADEHGWHLYIQDTDGRIRSFTVGVEDMETAQLAIQQHDPTLNMLEFVSKMRADSRLIQMLGLSGGKVMEWRTVEPKDSMTLHPGSVPIGSDYDPLKHK